nr:uncharacterized protein LOC125420389 [Ziziphus jujuba var. spinosa]
MEHMNSSSCPLVSPTHRHFLHSHEQDLHPYWTNSWGSIGMTLSSIADARGAHPHLRIVFKVLKDNELYVKREKCSFATMREVIKGYSALAAPLTDLLKKNKTWSWSTQCQQAFEDLKEAIMKEPVLALPDCSKPFERGGIRPREGDDRHHPLLAHLETLLAGVQIRGKDDKRGHKLFPNSKEVKPQASSLARLSCRVRLQARIQAGTANVVADALSRKPN